MNELTFDIENVKQMFDLRPFMRRILTPPRQPTPVIRMPDEKLISPAPQVKKAQADIVEQTSRRRGRAASRLTSVGLLDEATVTRPVLSDILG